MRAPWRTWVESSVPQFPFPPQEPSSLGITAIIQQNPGDFPDLGDRTCVSCIGRHIVYH